MKRRAAHTSERVADLVSLLVKAPRTVNELAELTDYEYHSVSRYLNALHAEGLLTKVRPDIGIGSGRGTAPVTWTWRPT